MTDTLLMVLRIAAVAFNCMAVVGLAITLFARHLPNDPARWLVPLAGHTLLIWGVLALHGYNAHMSFVRYYQGALTNLMTMMALWAIGLLVYCVGRGARRGIRFTAREGICWVMLCALVLIALIQVMYGLQVSLEKFEDNSMGFVDPERFTAWRASTIGGAMASAASLSALGATCSAGGVLLDIAGWIRQKQ